MRCELLPDGSGLLYDPRTQVATAITATAVQVWAACDGTRSPAAIADHLAATYDAPPEVILRDVTALLTDLGARGLLATGPESEPPA